MSATARTLGACNAFTGTLERCRGRLLVDPALSDDRVTVGVCDRCGDQAARPVGGPLVEPEQEPNREEPWWARH